MSEVLVGQIIFAVAVPVIGYHSIKDALNRQKLINDIADNIGKQKEEKRYRFYDPEWIQKRQKVFQRNGYKCVVNGKTGGELHAHHIIPKSEGGTDDLDNLVTLCRKHHAKEKSKGHQLIQTRLDELEEEEDYILFEEEKE